MKIFILEDNDYRIQQFKEWMPSADVAKDVPTALDFLKKNKYDLIFLDHDLGVSAFVESNEENTGYGVAKYILENKIDATVIIHSANPAGAANMKAVLPDATEMMFGTFIVDAVIENNEVKRIHIERI